MMTECFTSLSVLFKSYLGDGRMIMKGSVQCHALNSASSGFRYDDDDGFVFYVPFNII